LPCIVCGARAARAATVRHYGRMKLPEQGGNLCFPVLQECENGTAEWTQVPGDGQTLRDLKSPAAELELLAAPAGHVYAH
jgi:uncharacterized protein YcnI